MTMDDLDNCKKAIAELNGATFENREMVVNEAREKSEVKNKKRY